MPSNEEINMAINELSAISEQKREIIQEFGEKYKAIEKEVKDLERQKAALEASLRPIEDMKEEALVIVKQAHAQANEIIRGAQAEAGHIIDEAKETAGFIIIDADSLKKTALRVLDENNAKIDAANLRERTGKEYLQRAEKTLLDAEIVASDAHKAQEKAIRDQVEASGLLEKAEVKRKALEAFEGQLSMKEGALRLLESTLSEQRQGIVDDLFAFGVDKESFKAEKLAFSERVAVKDAEIEARMAALKEQEEANAWRSRELDIGFELIKNRQVSVDRDIKKLEGLKKELSK